MSETSNIKRIGSAEVTSKNGDDLGVRIRLSATPNAEWLQSFRDPISCQTNQTHPSNARLNSDNTLDFKATMGGLKMTSSGWINISSKPTLPVSPRKPRNCRIESERTNWKQIR